MKKQFLILFAFISVLALSQVPQRFNKVIVTGDITSPKFIKTGSTVDSVLLGNGSARSVNSLKTDTTSISARINLKEPLLPSTPSNPESRFLNGNKQWAEIVLGSGGYASNVYFTNLTSTIVGSYKQTSGTHELTETIVSGTCSNNEVLIHTYLFEQPVGITTVDAGVWRFTMNCVINSNVGDSKFKIVQFRRSSTGVETDMFTIYSNTIENTDYQNFIIETVQPSFLVDSLDRFGCRIYATTTTTVNKTISYKIGDGYASYLNTPLALRHDQNRDKNGNPLYQHVTTSDISKWNTTSANNTVDETLTSIKTKLGAASSVSDGYLRYQDFALLHTPTTVTASNGLSISGQNISLQNASLTQSGALTFNDYNKFDSKEPAITKNSGFNLPLGTTSGTVLEGRTFGSAASSNTGDYIQNQNSSIQNAVLNISGEAKVGSLALPSNGYIDFAGVALYPYSEGILGYDGGITLLNTLTSGEVNIVNTTPSTSPTTGALSVNGGVGADHVRANNFYGNGSNLTGVQLPITLTTNGTSGAATFSGNVLNVPNYGGGIGTAYTSTFTPITGLTSATFHNAKYTKVGSVYDASVSAHLVTNIGSGTCTFRFTLPSTPISSSNLHIWGVIYEQYHAYVVNFWLGSGTSNYQDINFTTSSASGTDFYAILNCKYE